jgi:hypothetical protein
VKAQDPPIPAARFVNVADADPWLEETRLALGRAGRFAVVAVLPDAEEVDMKQGAWALWFSRMVSTCFYAARRAPVVFALTDRRIDGTWVDKAAAVEHARPTSPRAPLVLHRIALRRPVGVVDLKRPTYTHVLAFGGRPGIRTADVFAGGHALWRNGVGIQTAREIASWLAQQEIDGVLNPFCGHGTLLAACSEVGLPAYGCDTNAVRAEIARAVDISQFPDPRKDQS